MENKMILISEKDWHFKLIKYTFGLNPKMFKNLCPYFWLFVASLFCVTFVFIGKILNKVFSYLRDIYDNLHDKLADFSNRQTEEYYKKYIKNMSKAEVYKIVKENNWDSFPKKFDRHAYCNYGRIKRDIEYVHKIDDSYQDEYFKIKEEKERKIIEKENSKEKANKIVKNVKQIAGFLITIIMSGLWFLLTILATWMIQEVINLFYDNPGLLEDILFYGGCAVLMAVFLPLFGNKLLDKIKFIFMLKKQKNNSLTITDKLIYLILFPFVFVFYTVIWKSILVSAYNAVIYFASNFFGIFSEYFGASYTDYCPGIDWEEDKNNLKKD